jgi:hypothetical protein
VTPQTALIVIVTAIVAAALSITIVKFLDRLRRKDAETEAQNIVERAERDATNRRK